MVANLSFLLAVKSPHVKDNILNELQQKDQIVSHCPDRLERILAQSLKGRGKITSESSNVILNPFHQKDLIFQANIQKSLLLGKSRVQESESADTVIERHNDERLVRPTDHRCAVMHLGCPTIESASMHVDTDR